MEIPDKVCQTQKQNHVEYDHLGLHGKLFKSSLEAFHVNTLLARFSSLPGINQLQKMTTYRKYGKEMVAKESMPDVFLVSDTFHILYATNSEMGEKEKGDKFRNKNRNRIDPCMAICPLRVYIKRGKENI